MPAQAARQWILYIEDNENDLILARELLSKSRYPVTWAKNADEARQRLRDAVFSLILLDHRLPDTNALAFLDELRATHPHIPVVILTGEEDDAVATSALNKGAADFVLKREMTEKLRTVVRQTIQKERRLGDDRFAGHAHRIYRTLFETMSDGCFVIDSEGVIMIANAAFGIEKIGHNVAEFTPLLESENVQVTRRPIGSSILVTVTDTSELVAAGKRLAELNRLKSEFVSIVSHDLRSPIATIKAMAENLIDGIHGEVAPDQRKALQGIRRKSEHLAKFIESLLDLARIEGGGFRPEYSFVDMAGVAHAAAADHAEAAARRNIAIRAESREHAECFGDETLLREVFANLIGNALQFAKSAVTISFTQTADAITATVNDDGPGIDPEDLEKIFEHYYQGKHGARSGLGLGLVIVRGIVEAHGGTVQARNKETGGAEFVVMLPKRPADQDVASRIIDLRGHRILVAEDDPECLETIAARLRQSGCEVIAAPDGYRAIEAATEHTIDVAVLDIEMPGLDGFEVLERFGLLENPPAVIFVTARRDLEDRVRGLYNGALGYVVKPFDAAMLMAEVGSALKQKDRLNAAISAAYADAMTGFDNLRGFEKALKMELARARRYDRGFALVYLDADGLKNVNDTLGHAAGDEFLKNLARAIKSSCRAVDRPARIGGDEFAVICPEVSADDAESLVARFEQSIRDVADELEIADFSASIGVAFFPQDAREERSLRVAADAALYRAKRGRRRSGLKRSEDSSTVA